MLFSRLIRPAFVMSQVKSLQRVCHSSTIPATTPPLLKNSPREIKFPTPFGHLAAQEWGPADGKPVLAVHGWLDNSGTFDNLIPMLNPNLHIVALDEPGIGFSSRLPPGVIINVHDYLYDIRRVIDQLKWQKVTLLGHSRGAGLSLLFAAIFPELIEKVICLDRVLVLTLPTISMFVRETRKDMDFLLKYESSPERPEKVYTYDQALERIMEGHHGSLTPESAKILLKRGTKPSADGSGYVFTRDIRLKRYFFSPVVPSTVYDILSNLRCELLIISATNPFPKVDFKEKQKFLDLYSKVCKRLVYEVVEGTHHVHLNNPERVAPIINRFFETSVEGSQQSNL